MRQKMYALFPPSHLCIEKLKAYRPLLLCSSWFIWFSLSFICLSTLMFFSSLFKTMSCSCLVYTSPRSPQLHVLAVFFATPICSSNLFEPVTIPFGQSKPIFDSKYDITTTTTTANSSLVLVCCTQPTLWLCVVPCSIQSHLLALLVHRDPSYLSHTAPGTMLNVDQNEIQVQDEIRNWGKTGITTVKLMHVD